MTPRLLNFASKENDALRRNGAHVFAATHALCIYPSNAIYTLIPKNACSTMRFSIAVANGAVARDGDVRWIHKNNGTFAADLRDLATASFTFVILRCPFDRLVSCFLNKIVDMWPNAWSLAPTSESDLNPADLSFREFVNHLRRKLRADVHWRPQSDFLVYRKYDKYFDFRDMATVANTLAEQIGLEIIDVRESTGHSISRLKRIEGNFADTPARELMALKQDGELPSLSSLFDAELWETVGGLYQQDADNYRQLAGGSLSVR